MPRQGNAVFSSPGTTLICNPSWPPWISSSSITAQIKNLTAGIPEHETRITLAERLLGEKIAELRETIRLRREQGFAAAQQVVQSDKGKAAMDELRRVVGDMETHERTLLDRRVANSAASLWRTILTLAVATLIALGSMIALYFHVRGSQRVLNEQGEWFRVTLESIGDAVIATDARGRVTFMNPVAEVLCGWGQADAVGLALESVFQIVREGSRDPVESPVQKVLRQGAVVGLANHTILIARDGTERPIDDSGCPDQATGRIDRWGCPRLP